MKRSTNGILTTHVGSLPRPVDLLEMNDAKANGRPVDSSAWTARVKTAVLEVVRLQRESGVDIVNDGELSKSSWSSYVNERLSGFAESVSRGQGSLAKGRDKRAFQEFYDEYDRIQPFRTVNGSRWTDVICNAPILYTGQTAVQTDIENLQSACAGIASEEAFITAVAPGSIITRRVNQYYPTEEAFLFAIADAMRTEYKAIVDAGFLLQIDDPQLVTRYDMEDPPPDAGQYRKLAAVRVEALNHALADIPQDRVRYHICWGGWHGPHTTDLPFGGAVPRIHPEGPQHLGVRVPALIISPWVSSGSVCKTVFDHTSILKTILVRHRARIGENWFTQFGPRVNTANHLGIALDLDTPRSDRPSPIPLRMQPALEVWPRARPTYPADGDQHDFHASLARAMVPRPGLNR